MKTSNYITVSYFFILFGGILVLFIAAKLDTKADVEVRSMLGVKELKHFSVVVTEAKEQLILKQSQKQELLTSYNEGDQAVYAPHELRNDTLFILKNPKSDYQFIQVHCSGIKSIVGKEESWIRIDECQGDTLMIKLEKARLFYNPSNALNNVSLLSIYANQSDIQMGIGVKNLIIQSNSTKFNGWNNSFKSVSASLNNYSSLFIGQTKQINLEADSTSTYTIQK